VVYTRGETLLAAPFDLERLELRGESVPLSERVWAPVGTPHFAFSQDGTLIYIPGRSLERTLSVVDRTGFARPLTEIRRAYFEPRLSPDGKNLAVTIEGHIWIYEMALDALSRATFGPYEDAGAIWTPDGKRLAFRRNLPSNVFWQAADGAGEAERLTASENMQRPTSWSPDGKTLVYTEMQKGGHYDIEILTLQGEARSSAFLDSPFNESGGVLSPDGRFLAYMSDETGRREVYVRDFPRARGKWQISNEGGRHPVWARSGRELFYRKDDDMMVVDVGAEPAFRAGKPTLLFGLRFVESLSLEYASYDVAPGDENFIVVQDDESMAQTQIHVVLNWFEELKRLVPTED
jgi:eukaryotic-like serine/threonine-protein kinase